MAILMDVGSAKGILILITAIISTMLIIGGNTLTIVAILKRQKLATPSNQFIMGLAFADLLVGFTIPYCTTSLYMDFEDLESWKFIVNCVFSIFPLLMCGYNSLFHIFIIAVDRFLSLAAPLRHKVHITRGRCRLMIAFILCFSFILTLTPIFWNKSNFDPHIDTCTDLMMPYNYFTFIISPIYILFIILFVCMYIRIYVLAARRATTVSKPLKVIGPVIGCTIVCWTPFFTALFLKITLKVEVNETLYLFIYCLVTMNSFCNPIIYALKNKDFRNSFRQTLQCSVSPANTLNAPPCDAHRAEEDRSPEEVT